MRVVGDGKQREFEPPQPGEVGRDLTQRASGAEPLGAPHVRRQVAVADLEPRLLAQLGQLAERRQRVAAHAPAEFALESGKGVDDRVDVGRDVQPMPLEVVADVADGGDVRRVGGAAQPFEESGGAHAAGQHGDAHRPTSRPRA